MAKSSPAPSSADPKGSEDTSKQSDSRKPYEPPRIERLGNLRELLAKSGAPGDTPGPHPTKP